MKHIKKALLILVLPLFAFVTAHKFYVSVTNVGYSEKDKSIQITSRIFIDDLDAVLLERYDVVGNLGTGDESKTVKEYVEKYLRAKFKVVVNGEDQSYILIGKKYDADVCIFYIEVPQIELQNLKSIEIENQILTDLYDEQQNVLHFKIKDTKKSFVLLKSDTKGMLKL